MNISQQSTVIQQSNKCRQADAFANQPTMVRHTRNNQTSQLTRATVGRTVLFLMSIRYRYSKAVQDMYTSKRPQPGLYMPVLLLYKRLRRSGLTEKNCEQGMLLENRHPTGKLSEKTAQSGWAPKLHTAAAGFAVS